MARLLKVLPVPVRESEEVSGAMAEGPGVAGRARPGRKLLQVAPDARLVCCSPAAGGSEGAAWG